MLKDKELHHLILLIGTNPLPNFVVADYFLRVNPDIRCLWLIHSEANGLQAGTDKQAKNLEHLLRRLWEGKHQALRFPLEKISLSDVSDAETILREINREMLDRWPPNEIFHLNYTGGTKAMAAHVYRRLQEIGKSGRRQFSYLDANNFRLVVDGYGVERFEAEVGVETHDIRQKVHITFEDLIALHGFQRLNKDTPIDRDASKEAYNRFLDIQGNPTMNKPGEGCNFEGYIFQNVEGIFNGKLQNEISVYHNWVIGKPDWKTKFQLDLIVTHGYHLTGMSITCIKDKDPCKLKGFEIIHRTRQIGGDEARSVLITRANRGVAQNLQDELTQETGGQENILVLGIDDFLVKEDLYLSKIEEFILG